MENFEDEIYEKIKAKSNNMYLYMTNRIRHKKTANNKMFKMR